MKTKYLFVISLLSVFVYSDVLYIKKNRCIHDNYYFTNKEFNYTYSSTGNSASTLYFKAKDLEFGYEYVNNVCQKIAVLKTTNMTYADYKFMTALTGLLIGFVVFLVSILLFIKRG